jgi:hypothetical protein
VGRQASPYTLPPAPGAGGGPVGAAAGAGGFVFWGGPAPHALPILHLPCLRICLVVLKSYTRYGHGIMGVPNHTGQPAYQMI